MKSVAFFEILHHHECIENAVHFLQNNKKYAVEIHLGEFVHKKIQNQLSADVVYPQPQRNQWLQNKHIKRIKFIYACKHAWESWFINFSFIKQVRKNQNDYIYINTPTSILMLPLIVYVLCTKQKYFVVIHNTLFSSERSFLFTPFDYILHALYRRAEQCVVLGEYISYQTLNISRQPIVINNRVITTKSNTKRNPGVFVVPGSYKPDHKDYKTLIEGFKKALDQNSDLTLVFLSKLHPELEALIKQHKIEKNTTTFKSFVEEEDFSKHINRASACIIPTRGSVFGNNKISGAWGDAVGFRTPIVCSTEYASSHTFPKGILRYNDESDLTNVFLSLSQEKFQKDLCILFNTYVEDTYIKRS